MEVGIAILYYIKTMKWRNNLDLKKKKETQLEVLAELRNLRCWRCDEQNQIRKFRKINRDTCDKYSEWFKNHQDFFYYFKKRKKKKMNH